MRSVIAAGLGLVLSVGLGPPAGGAEAPDPADLYRAVSDLYDRLLPLPNPNEFRCRGLAPIAPTCEREFEHGGAARYSMELLPGSTSFVGVIEGSVTDSGGHVAARRCVYPVPFMGGACEYLAHPDLASGSFRLEGKASSSPEQPAAAGEFVVLIRFEEG